MVAARTYARRGPASAEFRAWLDAVEAECETRCGNTRTALHLIGHAEDTLAAGSEHATPAWMDWFSPARLAAFKGNTQLKAGHLPQARATLAAVLEALPPEADKQRTVVFGDLAAVEARQQPGGGMRLRLQALDSSPITWYATGMDRVREVRARSPHGRTSSASGTSTTASTTGGRRSALSSVELGDLLRQLRERVDTHRRDRVGVRVALLDGSPRPRRIRAVRSPACTAGRMSLSSRSPTYRISPGSAGVALMTCSKNSTSGFDAPQSSLVAIMSAGRSSPRSRPPARTSGSPRCPPTAQPPQGRQRRPHVRVKILLAEPLRLPAAARFSRSSVRSKPGRNSWKVSR